MLASGMEQGANESLDQLEELLAGQEGPVARRSMSRGSSRTSP